MTKHLYFFLSVSFSSRQSCTQTFLSLRWSHYSPFFPLKGTPSCQWQAPQPETTGFYPKKAKRIPFTWFFLTTLCVCAQFKKPSLLLNPSLHILWWWQETTRFLSPPSYFLHKLPVTWQVVHLSFTFLLARCTHSVYRDTFIHNTMSMTIVSFTAANWRYVNLFSRARRKPDSGSIFSHSLSFDVENIFSGLQFSGN